MRGIILALVLLQSEPHIVYVSNDKGNGSGFVVGDGLVMTAHHLYRAKRTVVGEEYRKEAEKSVAVAQDKANDVVLLRAPLSGHVTFATPVLGEEVTTIGYSLGIASIFVGRVAAVGETVSWVDIRVLRGSSGSPVFNQKGEVVGMIVGFMGDGFNYVTLIVNGGHLATMVEAFKPPIQSVEGSTP